MPAITITSTPDAFEAAAQVLLHSVNRGDFDEDPDFEAAAATAAGYARSAAVVADEDDTVVQANLDTEHLDEILAVLESDRDANRGPLARFLGDANTALAN